MEIIQRFEQGSIPAFVVIFIILIVGLIGMIMISSVFETQYSPFVNASLHGSTNETPVLFSSDVFNNTQQMTTMGTTVITSYLWVFILFAIILTLLFLYAFLR